MVVIFLMPAVATWLRELSHAYWAGCVTAVLSLLYDRFGQSADGLLHTRLAGIAVGALLGLAASWLVGIAAAPLRVLAALPAPRALSAAVRACTGPVNALADTVTSAPDALADDSAVGRRRTEVAEHGTDPAGRGHGGGRSRRPGSTGSTGIDRRPTGRSDRAVRPAAGRPRNPTRRRRPRRAPAERQQSTAATAVLRSARHKSALAVASSSSACARAVSESSWPASIRDSSRIRSSPSSTFTPDRVTDPSLVFSTSNCRSAKAAT